MVKYLMDRNYLWAGKVQEFIQECTLEALYTASVEIFNERPSPQQKKAWEMSLKIFKKYLAGEEFQDLTIIWEFWLRNTPWKMDIVILGQNHNGKPQALIIETKGMTDPSKITDSEGNLYLSESGNDNSSAVLQLNGYLYGLTHFHADISDWDINGTLICYNIPRPEVNDPVNFKCFYHKEGDKFLNHLQQLFKSPVNEEYISTFLKGTHKASLMLMEMVTENIDVIEQGTFDQLAGGKMRLDSIQTQVINDVLTALSSNQRKIFLIQGGHGSGKSLIALLLLFRALKLGKSPRLTYRNNRFINTTHRLKFSLKDGSTMQFALPQLIGYFAMGGRGAGGLADKPSPSPEYDLVIYDEAQRMRDFNIRNSLNKGEVVVILFDENQILNEEESGTVENFRNALRSYEQQHGIPFSEYTLEECHRTVGGQSYATFVEQLLSTPTDISEWDWQKRYEIKVFDSFLDLKHQLQNQIAHQRRVNLLAAFTEGSGKEEGRLRIGSPLQSNFELYKGLPESEFVYWLMDEKVEYPTNWLEVNKYQFSRCASIYGSQGFETEYVGLIWGRDLVIRNGQWAIGPECKDNVGFKSDRSARSLKQLVDQSKTNPQARDLAIKLLKNRYRIFLGRGIYGTYIWCEDEETRKYFSELI